MDKSINKALLSVVKKLKSLSNHDLEQALLVRTLYDKKYLFKKNKTTSELLEGLSFRDMLKLSPKSNL